MRGLATSGCSHEKAGASVCKRISRSGDRLASVSPSCLTTSPRIAMGFYNPLIANQLPPDHDDRTTGGMEPSHSNRFESSVNRYCEEDYAAGCVGFEPRYCPTSPWRRCHDARELRTSSSAAP